MTESAPTPSVPNPCSVCGIPIFGSFVGTGDGSMANGGSFAHPECYWRQLAKETQRRLIAAEAKVEALNKALELSQASAANARAELAALRAEAGREQEALEKIARWHGEFPEATDRDGKPSSYGVEYGSNGERDYMRQVALNALAARGEQPK